MRNMLKSLLALLLATSAAAIYDCPPLCKMFCEFGYVNDSNGCPTCKCNPSECPLVKCAMQCPNGFKVDENGCQGCECVDPIVPPAPPTIICGIGQEYDDITNQCVAVSCDAASACGENEICTPVDIQCIRAPCPQFQCEPQCPPVCLIFCQYGNVLDDNGCPTCNCNPQPGSCKVGEEYDSLTDQCVIVSCESPDACRDDQSCVPAEFMCVRAPCPQFQCEDKVECGPGEAFDDLTGECVIVSCESPDACRSDEICEFADIQCIRAPCPAFQCKPSCPRGEEMVQGRCRPVSCDSPRACSTYSRCVSVKRSCHIRQSYCPQYGCYSWWNWWH